MPVLQVNARLVMVNAVVRLGAIVINDDCDI